MATYEYCAIVANHEAKELSINHGGVPEFIEGAYFRPLALFNQLGADGWRLATSIREEIPAVGPFSFHYFVRETQ